MIFLDSKERKREAEITHSEHPLKYYVVRLDRISPYGINIQPLVNLQVLSFSMFVQLPFYPQMQCKKLGLAIMISPNIPKLAITPLVVGEVRIDT